MLAKNDVWGWAGAGAAAARGEGRIDAKLHGARRLVLLVAVHAQVCCHALPMGTDSRAPAVLAGVPLAVMRADARARRRCGARQLRGGEGETTPNAMVPSGLLADSNATERSEFDGILVSFCEPEPAAAAERRPALKFAERFWGASLCTAAAGLLLLRVAGRGSAAWIERALDPWVEDEARLDLYLGCGITAVFGAGALACRNVFDDPAQRVKKHAWVISVLAAGVCFVAAVLVHELRPPE